MEGMSRPLAPARVSSVLRRLLVRVTPAAADDVVFREKDLEREEAPRGGGGEAEVRSVALDRMVRSFMEDTTAAAVERPPPRRRCNCFNGGHQDASDDDEDFDFLPSSSSLAAAPAAAGDAVELLKGLVQCASKAERTLLADASRIAEGCRGNGRKKTDVRRAVASGLRVLGYDAAVCRSRWDGISSGKGASGHPAGEHEYVDVVAVPGPAGSGAGAGAGVVRLVVEVDFRAEFEVARPTKAYRAALQALPLLFVGTPERAARVAAVVADAARLSLRKRGLHVPPWRKPEYVRAKWTAPHVRDDGDKSRDDRPALVPAAGSEVELLRFDGKVTAATAVSSPAVVEPAEEEEAGKQKPQSPPTNNGKLVVTGLASVL